MPISFTNSRFPCFDFEESCLTAIVVPSNNSPYNKKNNTFEECEAQQELHNWHITKQSIQKKNLQIYEKQKGVI